MRVAFRESALARPTLRSLSMTHWVEVVVVGFGGLSDKLRYTASTDPIECYTRRTG
jgi:hypothetical protein